jgi:hypothetical protein
VAATERGMYNIYIYIYIYSIVINVSDDHAKIEYVDSTRTIKPTDQDSE